MRSVPLTSDGSIQTFINKTASLQHPVCAWGSQDGLDAEQKKNGSGLWVILKDQKGKANLPLLHLSLLRQEKTEINRYLSLIYSLYR